MSTHDLKLTMFALSWTLTGAIVGVVSRLKRGHSVGVMDLLGCCLLGYIVVLAEFFLILNRVKLFK